MRVKGRIWVGAWLLFGLAIFAWVVWRDTSGFAEAGRLEDLRSRRSILQSRRAELSRRVRQAGSRAILIPRAESLGLRLSADSEIVILQAPIREGR